MTMAFWSGINIASLIILCLMYWNTGKDGTKIFLDLKLFRYFQVAVLLHLIFDTMGYLLIKEPFAVSLKMAYAVNTLYYITVPIPPFIWFLVCDYKVYNNAEGLKKRLRIYLIPIVIHTVFVMFTPLHGLTFYIDAESIYHRGTLAAFTWIICWLFSFGTYPMLAIKTKNKPALQPKGLDVYYYLFQVAPIVFSVIQVLWHGSLLISLGLVISTFIIFANVHSRRLTEIAVAKGTEKTMRELEMKVAELTATFNAIPDLLCIKDLDFVITECNNALLTHYGIRREDIVGTSTKQGVKDANYTDEEIEMYSTCDQRAVDECIPILNEEPIPRFDGTQPLFETIKAPIIINDKVVGIVAVARDLTKRLELQKAELDKEQAEKRAAQMENEMTKSRIAVMLSQVKPHFLFNALTAISQLCDIDPVRAKRVTIEFSNYLRGNMTSLDE
ncbi:MAG: histidine kinase, partial [Treponema sp.]|nr:histidine kinase [Treponema sp.]